jgi:DNA-binding transcriptional LysR family regulator
MSNLPDLEALAVFARVAELRSFSAAARELRLSKATVSKLVARLEARLGAGLLNRTSRRLALTDAGLRLQGRAAEMLARAEAAESECLTAANQPRGLVRLAAPMSFGLREVAPLLPAFLEAYPDISVDLHLSDALVDLVGGGFDAALRIGVLPDSAMTSRRLRRIDMRLLAAPAYLAARGRPAHPADLAAHAFLGYAYAAQEQWRFTRSDGEAAVARPTARLRATSGDALMPALIAGLGVAVLPAFIAAEALAAGALVELLEDWTLPAGALHLLTPSPGPRPARVAALTEFFARRLGASAATRPQA